MHRWMVLSGKEFKQLFFSPTGFLSLLFSSVFLNIALLYFVGFFNGFKADLSPYFGMYPTLFILIVPILNLKLFLDDKKFGTQEIILTLPYTEWDIVFSRFNAVFSHFFIIFLTTLIMPLSLLFWGDFDRGVIVSSLIGVFLNGAASIGFCVLISHLNRGSISSWFFSLIVLLFLNGSYIDSGFFSVFSFSVHMESFSRGVINPGDFLFFIAACIFPLYISSRILYIRRWN